MYCPHHGCIFDIKSGSIEHGPSLYMLPRFHADEKDGMVRVLYPFGIPSAVDPDATTRDVEDLRKVMILGGDDAATVGCLNGLRQFGYQGEINVVKEGADLPFRQEYMHRAFVNLHLNDSQKNQQLTKPTKDTKK